MGNNGVQEPVVGFKNGQLIGTKRLYEDGKFTRHGREDGKALFCAGEWRGLQAAGKAPEGQLPLPHQQRPLQHQLAELVPRQGQRLRRRPLPLSLSPDQSRRHGGTWRQGWRSRRGLQRRRRHAGDGLSEPTAKKNETFMLFGAPSGTQGNVINAGVNELILPNYKQTWANIRKISDAF
jgi:arsenite oxidase large subunit